MDMFDFYKSHKSAMRLLDNKYLSAVYTPKKSTVIKNKIKRKRKWMSIK